MDFILAHFGGQTGFYANVDEEGLGELIKSLDRTERRKYAKLLKALQGTVAGNGDVITIEIA